MNDEYEYDARIRINALVRCLTCFALVNYSEKNKHTQWHKQLIARLEQIEQWMTQRDELAKSLPNT